jgi:hypothetical protein
MGNNHDMVFLAQDERIIFTEDKDSLFGIKESSDWSCSTWCSTFGRLHPRPLHSGVGICITKRASKSILDYQNNYVPLFSNKEPNHDAGTQSMYDYYTSKACNLASSL